jgi:peptide/nickel transport system ATP-binding protein
LETKELSSIDGSPPDLADPPTGCRFHPRCPYAQEICTREVPALLEYREQQVAACHFGKDFL